MNSSSTLYASAFPIIEKARFRLSSPENLVALAMVAFSIAAVMFLLCVLVALCKEWARSSTQPMRVYLAKYCPPRQLELVIVPPDPHHFHRSGHAELLSAIAAGYVFGDRRNHDYQTVAFRKSTVASGRSRLIP